MFAWNIWILLSKICLPETQRFHCRRYVWLKHKHFTIENTFAWIREILPSNICFPETQKFNCGRYTCLKHYQKQIANIDDVDLLPTDVDKLQTDKQFKYKKTVTDVKWLHFRLLPSWRARKRPFSVLVCVGFVRVYLSNYRVNYVKRWVLLQDRALCPDHSR